MRKIVRFLLNNIPRPLLIRMSYVFMRILSFFYSGNNVECPICGGRFRKFLPYGYNSMRENALCPKCMSLERHRLLWLFLKNRTTIFTESLKVLHIAPEQCIHKRFRTMKNLTYITADLESPLADVKLDVQHMPFPENEFDVIICNHVLEHVPDDKIALNEIYRVIKPGGYAILQVPIVFSMNVTYEDPSITDPAERLKHFKQKDHYRIYGNDYLNRIREAGFIIKEENYLQELSNAEKERFSLPEMEFMYRYYKS